MGKLQTPKKLLRKSSSLDYFGYNRIQQNLTEYNKNFGKP